MVLIHARFFSQGLQSSSWQRLIFRLNFHQLTLAFAEAPVEFMFLLLAILLHSSHSCTDGLIACPPGTPSSGVCVPTAAPWCSSTVWRNPFASIAARIADVLPQLTLQEKVNLLQTTPINASEVPRLGIFRTATAECLHGYWCVLQASPSRSGPRANERR